MTLEDIVIGSFTVLFVTALTLIPTWIAGRWIEKQEKKLND